MRVQIADSNIKRNHRYNAFIYYHEELCVCLKCSYFGFSYWAAWQSINSGHTFTSAVGFVDYIELITDQIRRNRGDGDHFSDWKDNPTFRRVCMRSKLTKAIHWCPKACKMYIFWYFSKISAPLYWGEAPLPLPKPHPVVDSALRTSSSHSDLRPINFQ